jgi:hypothetical protein
LQIVETYLSVGNKCTWRDATGEIHSDYVAPACDIKRGAWYCLTHQKGFRNNLETNGHTDDGTEHAMIWICAEHGPEVV